jgi:high-affinity Fe2+/Pb2+ permease
VSPAAADAIRKLTGYLLATVLTLLLFRIFGRLSNGRQALLDGELAVFVVLGTLAVAWVRAAKRIRQAQGAPPPEGPAADGDDQRL